MGGNLLAEKSTAQADHPESHCSTIYGSIAGSQYREAHVSVDGSLAVVLPCVFTHRARDNLCECVRMEAPWSRRGLSRKGDPWKVMADSCLFFLWGDSGLLSQFSAELSKRRGNKLGACRFDFPLFPITSFTILASVYIKKTGQCYYSLLFF